MAFEKAPVAVCTGCGTYSRSAAKINERCTEYRGKKRCKGVFESALNNDDWRRCPDCNGNGCEGCQWTGWRFVRYE